MRGAGQSTGASHHARRLGCLRPVMMTPGLRGALFLLGIIAFTGETWLPLGVLCAQAAGISTYEIVIPERLPFREKRHAELRHEATQAPWEDNLSYSIEAAGRTYLLMLKRNTGLLSDHFTQSMYTEDGRLETSHLKSETHCYYHGSVDGVNDSMVALSTCHGLRGVLHVGEESYVIEPIDTSSHGEHLLYQLQDVQKEPAVCGVVSADGEEQQEAGRTVKDFLREMNVSHTAFTSKDLHRHKRAVLPVKSTVELSVMVDNNRYKAKNSDESAVQKDVFLLVNIVDGMFRALNIQIVLIEMNIWETANPFEVMIGSAGDVLGRFSAWRGSEKGLKRSDASHLLVGRGAYDPGVVGMAFVGTVCSPTLASSISTYSDGSTPMSQATIVAHELGHNLGMNHDDNRCPNGYIMFSSDSGAKNFSTCSSDDFEKLILNNKGICLKNPANPNDVLTDPVCGNNVVDRGEQCDCGSVQECRNPCCNAADCTLTSGSQCAEGLCCENCKFKSWGKLCRPQIESCDLPEYCNGTHALCPADFYVMDGYPCNNTHAYCFDGRCQTLEAQCRALFGGDITKAVDGCFQVANLRGDQYGNCGPSGTTFLKCPIEDSLCGKLQCKGNFPKIPNANVLTFYYNDKEQCVSIDFNLGPDVPDPGMVHVGTACDTGKACVNYHCVNSSKLGYNCDVKQKCHDHGVCNNNGNCHCIYGWAPPSCDRGGYGGSIDSGPPPFDNPVLVALLVIFLVVVPILVLIILFFKRNAIKRMIRQRKERRYRSDNNQQQIRNSRPNPSQNQQRNQQREESNVNVVDVFTISRFSSPRPPATSSKPPRPPPPGFATKPPIPPRPSPFQYV